MALWLFHYPGQRSKYIDKVETDGLWKILFFFYRRIDLTFILEISCQYTKFRACKIPLKKFDYLIFFSRNLPNLADKFWKIKKISWIYLCEISKVSFFWLWFWKKRPRGGISLVTSVKSPGFQVLLFHLCIYYPWTESLSCKSFKIKLLIHFPVSLFQRLTLAWREAKSSICLEVRY